MIEPRAWQEPALEIFGSHTGKSFLLEATPGAGKTVFSGFCARRLHDENTVDFSLIVVPGVQIKGTKDAGFLADWHACGIEITRTLKAGQGAPTEYQGAVITYQQLVNLITTLGVWKANGTRIFLVFDEVHHACDTNVWGAAANAAADCAVKVLAMTGTPFRSDGDKIMFVNYDEQKRAVPDFKYSYREAVRDRVCREVEFITDDGLAKFSLEHEVNEKRISEAKGDYERHVARVIFDKSSQWLHTVMENADAKIDEYRTFDIDAGGLIVCRPGIDEFDDKHLRGVAKALSEIVGETAEIITHEDDAADEKIDLYRKGQRRWIAAVRKISEGVDIKRLRVLLLANNVSSEMLFRQIIGRILRVDDKNRPGTATVFMPKLPQLVEWAARISEEAEAGKKERDEGGSGPQQRNERDFRSLGSTHEFGGGISNYGESYTGAEIIAAHKIMLGDPELIDIPITKVAHLLRKAGVEPPPVDEAESSEPLSIRKEKLRSEIDKKAKALAMRARPASPDFKGVWKAIGKLFNAWTMDDLVNNKSIEVMRQVEDWLDVQLAGRTNAYADARE